MICPTCLTVDSSFFFLSVYGPRITFEHQSHPPPPLITPSRNLLPLCSFDFRADPGYVTGVSRADQSSLERRVNFSELISPSTGPVDTTNVSLYEALKSVIEWTGQVMGFFLAYVSGVLLQFVSPDL